ncbi:MAG: phosphatidate cytidylyltransferase [Oscillospiraceae bacterium]
MKTRVIVGVIAIPALIIIVFFLPPLALGLLMGAIAACGTWEFFHCTKPGLDRHIPVVCAFLAAILPISESLGCGAIWSFAAFFLLMLYLFGELMLSFRKEETLDFDVVTVGVTAGFAIPYFLTSIVRLAAMGNAFVALPFIVAFASDSGAYFVGVFLGKHKLVPKLSPKKTIEGSVGGFLITIVVLIVYGVVLKYLGFHVRLLIFAVYGLLGSFACQFGDLSFSAIKRIGGIKDYSNLIPGHGGVLDRFDGMVFVAALMELLLCWVPAFTA